jgi:hypothetical protein
VVVVGGSGSPCCYPYTCQSLISPLDVAEGISPLSTCE